MIRPLAASVLLLAGCSGGGADAPGTGAATAARADTRPTIVSLNPCTDAVLTEVAAPGQLLAISHYSKDPQASSISPEVAARYNTTGGTVEEILALDPDLVVASSFIAPATRAALADLGIAVATFGITGDVAASETQIRELARLAGDPAAGERLIGRIDTALAAARPAAKERPVEALLWQPGGIVAGDQALVSDLLARTGFLNVAERRGLRQADFVALEHVVAAPPRVLLVAGAEVGQRHRVLDRLPAMQRAAFDPGLLYCGGPTIIRAARRLAEIRRAVLAAEAQESGA